MKEYKQSRMGYRITLQLKEKNYKVVVDNSAAHIHFVRELAIVGTIFIL